MYSFNYERIVDEHLSSKMKLLVFLNVGIANISKEYTEQQVRVVISKNTILVGSVLMIYKINVME